MDIQQILVPVMATFAVGGIFYVVAYPYLSGEQKAEKRKAALQTRTAANGVAVRINDVAKRRKHVADSLKELDARAKSKKVTFETKMAQAGLAWTKPKFYAGSALLAAAGAAIAFVLGGNSLLMAGLMAVVVGVGVPAWFISYRRKRRLRKFLHEFPASVDIIVRGIKAGIPLGDCIRAIATEASEPVKTEFRVIVEAQALGLTISEAVERLIERVPLPEANFFSIVINIQQKAGGNLAEALMNLSNVLRDRKKMRGKVKAMSSEAKASAGIIGCLPPLVGTAVFFTSPGYMNLLFTTSTGNLVLGGCALWMGAGVFIMKKMIAFDI